MVDEEALIDALTNQHIAGAALDVFEVEPVPTASALMQLPRVILGSHNASNTTEAVRKTNSKAVALISDFLEDGTE